METGVSKAGVGAASEQPLARTDIFTRRGWIMLGNAINDKEGVSNII